MVAPDVALNVPHPDPVHPVPETLQVTPALLGSLVTVAESGCVVETVTDAVEGATVTTTAGRAVSVTRADADFVASARDTAVIVTVAGLGSVAGEV